VQAGKEKFKSTAATKVVTLLPFRSGTEGVCACA
jgi:hypothetical protein